MPEGWSGAFSASGQRVSQVHARDGEVVDTVAFEMEIPLETEAGEYAVVLQAAGENFSDTLTVTFIVSAEELGQSSFEVEYPSQEGDAQTAFTFFGDADQQHAFGAIVCLLGQRAHGLDGQFHAFRRDDARGGAGFGGAHHAGRGHQRDAAGQRGGGHL